MYSTNLKTLLKCLDLDLCVILHHVCTFNLVHSYIKILTITQHNKYPCTINLRIQTFLQAKVYSILNQIYSWTVKDI